jgi:hypothetical protein
MIDNVAVINILPVLAWLATSMKKYNPSTCRQMRQLSSVPVIF